MLNTDWLLQSVIHIPSKAKQSVLQNLPVWDRHTEGERNTEVIFYGNTKVISNGNDSLTCHHDASSSGPGGIFHITEIV